MGLADAGAALLLDIDLGVDLGFDGFIKLF